jgi:phosphoglycolate phosphatase
MAIYAYLLQHGLAEHVALIVGRTGYEPAPVEPLPHLLRAAIGMLHAVGSQCVFVGDSVSDVTAGKLAGVPVIGYAPDAAKTHDLAAAGAQALATNMDEIRTAIRRPPPRSAAE